ncbi:Sterol uptake control protein 2 [Colletotrichum orbiculare MAFF 240422]|uniref:Sterol uptake control protein 2 n=1 Tax=Colletotrichum orbiculare (strain 104-T / ATCC 96160 / CBS 514.97 / LARS 414 / MAFF 240422) TaxID=1213857 RepID=A0A484FAH6_COLOR|nr:Sterol uptake control protein 2 [Colletotrichum orbiculare MAFF 240422]
MSSSPPRADGSSPGRDGSSSSPVAGAADDGEQPTDDRPATAQPASRTGGGRSGPRSRRGCWTCRTKKVKCDEQRPNCHRCTRLRLLCDYAPRVRLTKRATSRKDPFGSASSSSSSSLSASSSSAITTQRASSLFNPSAPATGACSLDLSSADHEAIRYFRTSFARLNHTKNPDFSLYSIMFDIAQTDPMVMHVVLALGGRELEFRRNKDAEEATGPRTPLRHYSSALRIMADAIGSEGSAAALDLDSVCTALYLMFLYEQKYGDERCRGLSNHLSGASLILQHRFKDLLLQLPPAPPSSPGNSKRSLALTRRGHDVNGSRLSLYSARMLVWIALHDAAAASYGLGGQLNCALHKIMGASDASNGVTRTGLPGSPVQPLDSFERLHRFSNPLYRSMWADAYPQAELLDDVENRNVYALLGACGQLRFMIAQLANLSREEEDDGGGGAHRQRVAAVDTAIRQAGWKFAELLEVAAELSVGTGSSTRRLAANIRGIVPHYHAVVLEFLRLTRFNDDDDDGGGGGGGLCERRRGALRGIMNLAFQAFKHEGDGSMTRIAWPLFVAALETDDLVHRDWVLARFRAMSRFGKNLDRAHVFLVETIEMQDRLGRQVDVRERFRSGEVGLFVI